MITGQTIIFILWKILLFTFNINLVKGHCYHNFLPFILNIVLPWLYSVIKDEFTLLVEKSYNTLLIF